jgi:divalent metal cation (Fe/Co/Zn/Cd) transporter
MAAAASTRDQPEVSAAHPAAVPPPGRAPARTDRLRRQGRRLEMATTAWNVGEVAATLSLGFLANSLALVAFGLDSLVEVFASIVVLWHLGGLGVAGRSRRATGLVSAAFVVLGLYLAAAGIHGLVAGSQPGHSPVGIAVLAATALAMALLARAKRRVGFALPSQPLLASAAMSHLDGALAAFVLGALVVDVTMGWWWADPAAALVVAVLAVKEGTERAASAV